MREARRYRSAAAGASSWPTDQRGTLIGPPASLTVYEADPPWRPTGIIDPSTGAEMLAWVGPERIGFLAFREECE